MLAQSQRPSETTEAHQGAPAGASPKVGAARRVGFGASAAAAPAAGGSAANGVVLARAACGCGGGSPAKAGASGCGCAACSAPEARDDDLARSLARAVAARTATTGPPLARAVAARAAAPAAGPTLARAVASPSGPPRPTRRVLQRSPGSPAGGCGVCHGTPRAAGIVAHEIIGRAFEMYYRGLVHREFPFVAPAPGDENGRLDLVMPTPTGFDIGEIKPANAAGLLQADLDLMWYEAQISRFFNMRVGRMTLPPPPMSLVFPNPQAPGCPAQQLNVMRWPQPGGIYLYSCEPDFSVLVRDPRCRCRSRQREPVPVPVPAPAPRPVRAPKTVLEKVREFVDGVVAGGRDAEEAARRFLEENPDVARYLAAAAIGGAIIIVVLTLAEDIATLGAGIADDPASFAAAFALVRVAQQMAR